MSQASASPVITNYVNSTSGSLWLTDASDCLFIADGKLAYQNIAAGATTKALRSTNFYFSSSAIPDGSTINGIAMVLSQYNIASNVDINDTVIQLIKTNTGSAGDRVGVNRAAGKNWRMQTGYQFGGPTDLWGTTWTPAEIRDNGFGLDMVFRANGAAGRIELDSLYCYVYFTPPNANGAFVTLLQASTITATGSVTSNGGVAITPGALTGSSTWKAAPYASSSLNVADESDIFASSARVTASATLTEVAPPADSVVSAAGVRSMSSVAEVAPPPDTLVSLAGVRASGSGNVVDQADSLVALTRPSALALLMASADPDSIAAASTIFSRAQDGRRVFLSYPGPSKVTIAEPGRSRVTL